MYLWLKALHIIAVISWMAGMLYLPRLFVYHCDAEPGSEQSETFKVMERRLLKAIINPAMIATWLLGVWLAWTATGSPRLVPGQVRAGGGDVRPARLFVRWVKRIRRRQQPAHGQKFYRIINEIPTVLMIAIVLLVTVKPF